MLVSVTPVMVSPLAVTRPVSVNVVVLKVFSLPVGLARAVGGDGQGGAVNRQGAVDIDDGVVGQISARRGERNDAVGAHRSPTPQRRCWFRSRR